MPGRRAQLEQAERFLKQADRRLRAVIEQVGPCRLRLKRDRFGALAYSIIAQQISRSAARAVHARLCDRLGAPTATAEGLASLSVDELRMIGVSRQKAGYLQDLAARTLDGQIRFQRFGRMSDDEIVDELVQVKGIGRWTAEMLLIFSLGRLDVLPVDDFGIRSGMRRIYKLPELPARDTCRRIGDRWRPFASIGSWYCWRSLEL